MSHSKRASEAEINEATRLAAIGAVVGAAKWGLVFAIGGIAAYRFSPLYRNYITVPFRVYLQMSGMLLGGLLEADSAVREMEYQAKVRWKSERDNKIWSRYEKTVHQELEQRARETAAANKASRES